MPKSTQPAPFDQDQLRAIAKKSTDWFAKHRRDLPWRKTRVAYRIWISESMLQQTQVATVIPYYERFLNRFPDIHSLASAHLDEVYQLWAGLGYYRRARQLHAAAVKVVESGQAPFPTDRDAIANLPGIGRYTANAIASFAYDQRFGIVEANTQRLYARLTLCKDPLSQTSSQKKLWSFAESIVAAWPLASGQLNQALMELGSQVCTPKNPACHQCPLAGDCQAHRSGLTDKIPVAKPKKIITELREIGLVVYDTQGRILLRRRQPSERWAGLWDFPRYDCTQSPSDEISTASAETQFFEQYGTRLKILHECVSVRHSVTRYRILLRCFEARIGGRVATKNSKGRAANDQFAWYEPEGLENLAMSASGRKVADWLLKHRSEEQISKRAPMA
jgi:A/G-specific adenine glycosylase